MKVLFFYTKNKNSTFYGTILYNSFISIFNACAIIIALIKDGSFSFLSI